MGEGPGISASCPASVNGTLRADAGNITGETGKYARTDPYKRTVSIRGRSLWDGERVSGRTAHLETILHFAGKFPSRFDRYGYLGIFICSDERIGGWTLWEGMFQPEEKVSGLVSVWQAGGNNFSTRLGTVMGVRHGWNTQFGQMGQQCLRQPVPADSRGSCGKQGSSDRYRWGEKGLQGEKREKFTGNN